MTIFYLFILNLYDEVSTKADDTKGIPHAKIEIHGALRLIGN